MSAAGGQIAPNWTADEIALLRSDATVDEIMARLPHRTRKAIAQKRYDLRITPRFEARAQFLAEHGQAFAAMHARDASDKELAEAFGLSRRVVQVRREWLGLPCNITKTPQRKARAPRHRTPSGGGFALKPMKQRHSGKTVNSSYGTRPPKPAFSPETWSLIALPGYPTPEHGAA